MTLLIYLNICSGTGEDMGDSKRYKEAIDELLAVMPLLVFESTVSGVYDAQPKILSFIFHVFSPSSPTLFFSFLQL